MEEPHPVVTFVRDLHLGEELTLEDEPRTALILVEKETAVQKVNQTISYRSALVVA